MFHKSLFVECEKVVKKVKKVAEVHDKFTILYELTKWEMLLMNARYYKGVTHEYVKQIYNEAEVYNQKSIHLKEQNVITALLGVEISNKGIDITRSKNDRANYKRILSLLKASEKKVDSNEALVQYYINYMLYHYGLYNMKKCLHFSNKLLGFIEKNDFVMVGSRDQLVLMATDYKIKCEYYLKKYEDSFQTIEKFKTINLSSGFLNDLKSVGIRQHGLILYIATGQFEKGVKLALEIEKLTHQPSSVLNRTQVFKIEFSFILSSLYFGLNDFNKALFWLNKTLKAGKEAPDDIYVFAKIFSLVLYYEIGNVELQEYAVRSTYRILLRRKRLYRFETVLLNFMRGSFHITERRELNNALDRLKTKFQLLEKDPFEREVFRYFDFIAWIDSKLLKKPFAQIVKEKAERECKLNAK